MTSYRRACPADSLRPGAEGALIRLFDAKTRRCPSIEAAPVLRGIDAFGDLPSSAIDALTRAIRIDDFEREEMVYRMGEPIDSLCIVACGRLLISCFSPAGRTMLRLVGRNGVFGEVLVDPRLRGRCQVQAHADTRLCRIPETVYMKLCAAEPELAIALARIATQRWVEAQQDLEDAMFLNARQRVLKLLSRLQADSESERWAAQSPLLEFSQDEVARMIGVTRERVNLILRDLEASGVIRIRIRALRVDSERLARAMLDDGLQDEREAMP